MVSSARSSDNDFAGCHSVFFRPKDADGTGGTKGESRGRREVDWRFVRSSLMHSYSMSLAEFGQDANP